MRLGLDGKSIPLADPLEKVCGRVIQTAQVEYIVLRLECVPIFRLTVCGSGGGCASGGGRGRRGGRGGRGRRGEQAGATTHGQRRIVMKLNVRGDQP